MTPTRAAALVGCALAVVLLMAPAAAPEIPRAEVEGGRDLDLLRPALGARRDRILEYYRAEGWRSRWTEHGVPTPQARALIARFERARERGLRPADYDGGRWRSRLTQLAAAQLGDGDALRRLAERFDLAVSVCATRYVCDLHLGRVDPHVLGFDLPRKDFDTGALLHRLAETADVDTVLDAIEPPFSAYRRLRDALPRFLALAAETHPRFDAPAEPGAPWAAAEALARFLQRLGDLPPGARWSTGVYDGDLVPALRRFQRRHGLEPDGRIGPGTLAALEVPVAARVAQIELTLERWRWLPTTFAAAPILVNIPEFRLRALRVEGEELLPELSLSVVVGQAFDHQTPVLTGEIQALIFHPFWNVPRAIVEQEILPALAADPRYLERHDYELFRGTGDGAEVVATTAATLDLLRRGGLELRQRPGPQNALGAVKFVFPNALDIYLHDTPARGAFARSRRDLSHGCVRVEDAPALVRWVLREQPDWDERRIAAALGGPAVPQTVRVAHPSPVLLLYGTALATRDGELHFFPDIYGHDRALADRLATSAAP